MGGNPVNYIDPLGLTTWPANGRVTSEFGVIENIRNGQPHNGIDIRNRMGNPVVASDSGTVVSVTPSSNGTHQLIIRNDDGSISGYAHVSPTVNVRQHVDEGSAIGLTDISGRSSGPHLHYTFRPSSDDPRVDPRTHLPEPKTCNR